MILGQADPPATTLTDLYTAPASTTATLRVLIANRTAGNVRVRISLAPAGAADALPQYIVYDHILAANEPDATVPFDIDATDVVRVESDTAGVSFNANGVERT